MTGSAKDVFTALLIKERYGFDRASLSKPSTICTVEAGLRGPMAGLRVKDGNGGTVVAAAMPLDLLNAEALAKEGDDVGLSARAVQDWADGSLEMTRSAAPSGQIIKDIDSSSPKTADQRARKLERAALGRDESSDSEAAGFGAARVPSTRDGELLGGGPVTD